MNRLACLRRNPKTLNYEYRKAIPRHLRKCLGRSEIKKSLGLKSYSTELLRLFYTVSLEVEQMIDNAKASTSDNSSIPLQVPTVYEFRVCMTRYIDDQMAALRSALSFQDIHSLILAYQLNLMFIEQHNQEIGTKARQLKDLELVKEFLSEDFKCVLAKYGYEMPENHAQYNVSLLNFKHVIKRINDAGVNLIHDGADITGYEGYRPQAKPEIVPQVLPQVAPEQPPQNTSNTTSVKRDRARPSKTMRDALEDYLQDRRLRDSRKSLEKDLGETQSAFMQFASMFDEGLDVELSYLDSDDADEFRKLMMQLPKAQKLKAFNAEFYTKPIRDQVELTQGAGLEVLSKNTVKNKLKKVSAVFAHAVDKSWMQVNIFRGTLKRVGVDRNVKTSEERTYTGEDLNKIFTGDIFVNREGLESLWRSTHGEATYWIPLIQYYAGARPEEVAQLYVKDFKEEDGVRYMHITDEEEDQSVKVEKRKVPVHPDLVKLGLYEYIKSLDVNGRLFPELSASTAGKYSEKVSASIGKRFRNHYLTSPDVPPLHGFRHTFRTIARRATLNMPKEAVDKIVGHKEGGQGEAYGVYTTRDLHEVMCRYPSINNLGELIKDSPWASRNAGA